MSQNRPVGPTKRQKEQRRQDRRKAKSERMAQRKARKKNEGAVASIEPRPEQERVLEPAPPSTPPTPASKETRAR